MTEETIKPAVQQTAYYLSNEQYPCLLVGIVGEFDKGVPYPLIAEAPDPSLKNPKFNRSLGKWVEMDPESQGAQIAQLQQENDALKKSNSALQSQLSASQKQMGELGIMVAKGMANKPTDNGGAQ
ncbi:hypothetical protein [Lactobacillus sp. ESL0677]|uniref:hypothetical protein n=1 Tax=Lactobacillus sp. ESL0677 TaxID=2983208 RepID=UPI0023F62E63|nr:hypothetical protein [Lactobacillus sp. ESL0677]WEV36205.1 hypothetical protein OZX76_05515 [Lactobacillus sp. ESL0677]